MEDSLLALLPVFLMIIFLLLYFCRYANSLEKCFSLKFLNCLRQRNEVRRTTDSHRRSRNVRRELTVFSNQRQGRSGDQDEAFILLKGQITRMVLAESEAMRLAKTLFDDNEFAARECIANLRSNLFPNLSVSYGYEDHEYEINPLQPQPILVREAVIEHIQKTVELPPAYEDCV